MEVRRELLDLARKAKKMLPMASERRDGQFPNHEEGVAVPAESEDLNRWHRLHQLIEELPARQREYFSLIYYLGWTRAQVAELFQVNECTVRRHFRLVVGKLRRALGQENDF